MSSFGVDLHKRDLVLRAFIYTGVELLLEYFIIELHPRKLLDPIPKNIRPSKRL